MVGEMAHALLLSTNSLATHSQLTRISLTSNAHLARISLDLTRLFWRQIFFNNFRKNFSEISVPAGLVANTLPEVSVMPLRHCNKQKNGANLKFFENPMLAT
jgi:hypothetical protein